jgi:MHS family proline/betaine transporter-like MFS transporter
MSKKLAHSSLARTVITSMMGNLFEWYDFALFGYFAPIIGKLFFPSDDPMTELISAFGVYAAGFLVRPLGGMFFGDIGDRLGRKKALIMTILLMAIPTTIIGILPTYSDIGVTASILLVLMRMLQGFSMGGNYGGSITFTTEHSPKNRRGLIGSFAVTSCLIGLMLGSATAALFSHFLTEDQLGGWGWRIPFLLGVGICFVGYYMRRNISESPDYEEAKESGKTVKKPLKELFQNYGKTLTTLVLVVMLHDLSFYILFVYMTTHLTEFLHFPKDVAFTINTINMIIVSAVTVGAAWLSDIYGRKRIMAIAALIFAFGTIPLMMIINGTQDTTVIFLAQTILAIGVGGYFGPLPAMMVESYPTEIRNSAVAVTTNISGPLFGGTAPMVVTYLITVTGSNLVPAYYLTVGAVIALISLGMIKLRNAN